MIDFVRNVENNFGNTQKRIINKILICVVFVVIRKENDYGFVLIVELRLIEKLKDVKTAIKKLYLKEVLIYGQKHIDKICLLSKERILQDLNIIKVG